MKALRYIFLLGSVGSLLTFSNCGGGGSTPEPVPDQQFTKLSSKSWTISTVTLDGTDRTAEYKTTSNGVSGDDVPMVLTISGTKGTASTYTYSVKGRPVLSPWPKSGNWEFGTDPTKDINRYNGTSADKLAVSYVVDGTNLQISFSYSGPGYANPRVGVVTGNWVFKFTGQ